MGMGPDRITQAQQLVKRAVERAARESADGIVGNFDADGRYTWKASREGLWIGGFHGRWLPWREVEPPHDIMGMLGATWSPFRPKSAIDKLAELVDDDDGS